MGIANTIFGFLDDYVKNPADTPDLTLGQARYDFTYRTFPYNLATDGSQNQHYMVININTQNDTLFAGHIQKNGTNITTFVVDQKEKSKTDALRFSIDKQYSSADGKDLSLGSTILDVLPTRRTRRIVESVALYMPSTLTFNSQANYQEIDLTSIGTDVLASGLNNMGAGAAFHSGNSFVDLFAGLIGGVGEAAQKLLAVGQNPINPMTEILFRTTPQRQFIFDFLMAPTCQDDSVALDQIIRTMRFHQAPEHSKFLGLLWTAPSEFDITFYKGGKENTTLPRINTCVLENLDVDFSPRGTYSTFSNGFPVAVRMTMMFRELEVVSKLRVAQGF